MARIVVTGAAGFIGSHVTEALLRRGDEVVGLDSFDSFYDPAMKRANLAAALETPGFTLREGDIRDADFVGDTIGAGAGDAGSAAAGAGDTGTAGIDAIIHLAARAGVRPSIENPLLYQDVNIAGTQVLLEAARRAGVRKFVFASSSSVYGNNEKVPFAEDDNVDFPISPYAATKKSGELLAHAYAHLFGLNIFCLRFFTVYGPRQRPDLAIRKFTRLIEQGQPIPVFGDGTTSRDYTFIDDIVDGVLRALDACRGYRIYNLGGSQPVTLQELITTIEKALGKNAMIDRLADQPGDVTRTFADITRAEAELGYAPKTRFEEGIEHFIRWYRERSHS